MTSNAFDTIMSGLDSPLIVVTAAAGRERAGCLVGFHGQSSITPSRYAVWLSKANHTYRIALRSTHLGLHFLTSHDLGLAELFGTQTGDSTDKFAGLRSEPGAGAVPVLRQCPNRIVARRTVMLDEGGDHACFISEPVEMLAGEAFEPFRLSQAAHLSPGHDSRDRTDPPASR
jgi:flavin reductase (DIM6/NTAB) family NADH-FMN oxidoreductase RutF